jgi:NTE family protein
MSHRRKTALVLGSGGARGWAHIGVIRALKRIGFEPDIVTGTSIGALIGAMVAADIFDAFDREVTAMSPVKLAKFFTEIHFPQAGILSGKPILEWLKQPHLLGNRTFADLKKPFATVATDLYRERAVVLSSGNVAEAVRASISIPGVFDPVVRGDAVLVDGGLVDPVPIKAARALGAERIIAVDINTLLPEEKAPIDGEAPALPSMVTTLLQTMRMIENTGCRVMLERDAPDLLLRPAAGHLHTLEFNAGKSLISAGEAAVVAAQKTLESWL